MKNILRVELYSVQLNKISMKREELHINIIRIETDSKITTFSDYNCKLFENIKKYKSDNKLSHILMLIGFCQNICITVIYDDMIPYLNFVVTSSYKDCIRYC